MAVGVRGGRKKSPAVSVNVYNNTPPATSVAQRDTCVGNSSSARENKTVTVIFIYGLFVSTRHVPNIEATVHCNVDVEGFYWV